MKILCVEDGSVFNAINYYLDYITKRIELIKNELKGKVEDGR